MIKRILRYTIWTLLTLVTVIALTFTVTWITEWRPEPVEVCYRSEKPTVTALPDTLTVISWNIGYAGLGDDMDFFYDGGKTTRTSEQRTRENLDSITHFLHQRADSVDFILLQEVDLDSKRSYGINEFEHLSAALPDFKGISAMNYVSLYVPIPVNDAIGRVKSGVVTFSKHPIVQAERLAYPGGFAFPVRLFNLKRCMLTAQIATTSDDTLWINNTHNTAFDTGGMRDGEIAFMGQYLTGKPLSITAGDWNSTPPGYAPSQEELTDPNFKTISVNPASFSNNMAFAADLSGTPSARFSYEPYKKGETTTTVIDFALLGGDFQLLDVRIVDLGFRNSDHNPVIYRVVRKH